MPKSHYDSHQLDDLVLQMMETELGGEQVYRTALTCAINPDLKKEWQGYLEETLAHQNVVRGICDALGLDPDTQSPTRAVVKHIGTSLVQAMQLAKSLAAPTPHSWWPANVWCTRRPRTTPTGNCWARSPRWPRAMWATPSR